MNRVILFLCFSVGVARAHDVITTPITYTREIYRIFQARCFSCHRPAGSAFPLMTYSDARPWAEAIKEEVLARTMPPWGAVKGFGDFRNDQALTPEQLEVIESWADGGVPEGEPTDLPPKLEPTEVWPAEPAHSAITVSGDFKVTRAITLDGLMPLSVPDKTSFQVTAELPDGSVEPLVWLQDYKAKFTHSFLRRTPLELPAGTVIRGVPQEAKIGLVPIAHEPATAKHTAHTPARQK
jgi:hypothetical protein